MNRLTRICAAAAFALAMGAPGAQAITFRFATEPIKVYVNPGQVVNRTFWLTLAKEEKETRFKAYTQDWWRSEDGQKSVYADAGKLAHSCANWVKLNPVESSVKGGETLNMRVSIAVPEDAKPGGYWCVLTVDEIPDPLAEKPAGIGVRFAASISLGIFVYVAPLDQRARITEVKVLPDRVEVALRNEGNCPLNVEGRFEFLPPGGKEPKAVVKLSRGILLPEPINTAVYNSKLPAADVLPSGRYLVRTILDIGLDHFIGAQKEMDVVREVPNAPQSPGGK